MRIKFELTGTDRKPLIKAIEEITGQKAAYSMSPKQYAYIFGEGFDLDKDGLLNAEGYGDTAELLERLAQMGFVGGVEDETLAEEPPKRKGIMDTLVEALNENAEDGEHWERLHNPPTIIDDSGREHNLDGTFAAKTDNSFATGEKVADGKVENDETDTYSPVANRLEDGEVKDSITIEITKNGSLSDEKFQNLLKLAESKQRLLTKALGAPLQITDGGDTVKFVFPFSDETGIGIIYSQLAHAMVKYVKKHQRVTATEKEVTSEKFSMRTFLVKLGMNGPEYSSCRKWMSRNLTGNASFAHDDKYTAMQESRRKTEENEVQGDE